MLIGTKKVNIADIERCVTNIDSLREYARSIMSDGIKDIDIIVNNQMYYCLMFYRQHSKKHWKVKKEHISNIAKDIRMSGYLTSYIEINDMCQLYISKKDYLKYL